MGFKWPLSFLFLNPLRTSQIFRKPEDHACQLLVLKIGPCPAVSHAAWDPQSSCPRLQHRDIEVLMSHASSNCHAAILTAPSRPMPPSRG